MSEVQKNRTVIDVVGSEIDSKRVCFGDEFPEMRVERWFRKTKESLRLNLGRVFGRRVESKQKR